MIYFDGENWQVNKYKVIERVETYSDTKEGYSENAIFEDIILSDDQLSRLLDLKGLSIPESNALDYINGLIELPDTRTNEQKLLDKLIELDAKQANSSLAHEVTAPWFPNSRHERFIYVSYEGNIYKTLHPVGEHENGTPPERPDLYKLFKGDE